jgi:5'-nucleotidase
MRALVTNDDGIDSSGLHTLARVAVDAGLDVLVAAPHAERSGASASLAGVRAHGRLVFDPADLPGLDGVLAYSVEATPAYITWAGIRGAFGPSPDLVLSGVNKGPNTGNAVLHSGTVGAALTASIHGVPAMAVSVSAIEPSHWDTAASVSARALSWLLARDPEPIVLNVNLPDVPLDELRGIVRAPLAGFGAVQADIAEIGEGFVTMTFSEIDVSAEPDSDAGLQTFGWATVTPLVAPCEGTRISLEGLVDGEHGAPR